MGDGGTGAVPPMSDEPERGTGHGCGVPLSVVVHEALEAALAPGDAADLAAPIEPAAAGSATMDRVRLSPRLPRADALRLASAARDAGLPLGAYVSARCDGIAAAGGARYAGHLVAATAACAELATLSRNLRHLGQLLREGSSRAAQESRAMLGTLDADVRRHLAVASVTLAALQPARPREAAQGSATRLPSGSLP